MDELNTKLIEEIFKLSRRMKEDLSYDFGAQHLSILQIRALAYIKRQGRVPMNEIASHFHIEMPSATSLVTKLAREKLVARQEDKKDRRMVKISLTPKGTKLLTSAKSMQNKVMTKHMSYLADTEKKQLLHIMQLLNQRLEAHIEK